MVDTIRKTRDNQGVFAAVMTDFSKGFDCISHELLIAKLSAYGLMKLHQTSIIVNKDVNFSSYADDTTPFITGMSFEQIIPKLESILSDISQWFINNNLKGNAGKFYLFLSPYEDQTIRVENYVIKSSGVEELLRVTIDSNVNFKEHILPLCKKANHKLHVLSRVSKYMTLNKRRNLMKSFII